MSKPLWKIREDLDDFTTAYIECALWSSTDESNESGGDPLDQNYDVEDIHADTLREMVRECAEFQRYHSEAYTAGGWSDEQAGHDFWLTRNGHGAGFWDRDRGLSKVGDELTEVSHAYGSVDLYVFRGKVRSN